LISSEAIPPLKGRARPLSTLNYHLSPVNCQLNMIVKDKRRGTLPKSDFLAAPDGDQMCVTRHLMHWHSATRESCLFMGV